MNNSTQISRNAQIDAIWANSKRKDITPVFTDTLKALKEMSDEDILSLYEQLPEEVVAEVTDAVLTDSNITAQITAKGEQYYTIGLPLVAVKDGVSFHFQHGDAVVVVSSDLDLYREHKARPIELGTILQFSYEGPISFKKLDAKGTILVANNDVENKYRGMLSKTCNPIFETMLAKKAIAVMEKKIALMEVADEVGMTIRQVRKIDAEDRKASVSALLKAKLGK